MTGELVHQHLRNAIVCRQLGLAQMTGQSLESHNSSCKGAPTGLISVPGKAPTEWWSLRLLPVLRPSGILAKAGENPAFSKALS